MDGQRLHAVRREHDLRQEMRCERSADSLLPMPVGFGDELETMVRQGSLAGVKSTRLDLVEDWMEQNNSAELVCRSLSAFNRLVIRAVLHAYAVEYPWLERTTFLEFGSGGRDEQVPGSDQDNGLLFCDGAQEGTPLDEGEIDDATHDIVVALDGAGIPLCTGNVMVSNPQWRGDYEVWRNRLGGWLSNPHEKGPWQSGVILDFQPVYGPSDPAVKLREWMWEYVRTRPMALRMMVDELTDYAMPLSFFGSFVTERSGPWAGHMDIKGAVLAHMTNCARILCLKHDIGCVNTCDRLRTLRSAGHVDRHHGDALLDGWEWLQSMRLHIGISRLRNSQAPHNRVLPSDLSSQQKQNFKAAIHAVEKLVRLVQAGAGL
jgi:CBS domain-containing protein